MTQDTLSKPPESSASEPKPSDSTPRSEPAAEKDPSVVTTQTRERVKKLAEVKSWYHDRYQTAIVHRNILLALLFILLISLGAAVFAVVQLNASKVFEPFVIEVEKKTGIVTQLNTQQLQKYEADDAIIRYFLVKYMQARENYNAEDYQYFYSQVVRLLSSADVYWQFRQVAFNAASPQSPLALGRQGRRSISIKSITYLDDTKKKVQIRIVQNTSFGSAQQEDTQRHYIVTLNYDFLPLDLSPEERYINPLGFQVVSYTKEEEIQHEQ